MVFRGRRIRQRAAAPVILSAETVVGAPKNLAEPWRSSLELAISEVETADPLYRPTSFWQPGFTALMGDLSDRGIDTFKNWPSAHFFFYPTYSPILTYAQVDAVLPALKAEKPTVPDGFFKRLLIGAVAADADMDIALALLDDNRLPLKITQNGESIVGTPPQRYVPFGPDGPSCGKPYLNYLKVLAAISRYIDGPPSCVVEIGSGFGVMGEILKSSFPNVQYVNLDIPPLSVLAHYYLSTVFPNETFLSNLDVTAGTAVSLGPGNPSASLSSWHLPLLTGSADIFINSFSFQEMEPHVVENYARLIAGLDTRYVISVNSRKGKPLAKNAAVGVETQVTSDFICDTFATLGYEPIARIGRPVVPPQAELLVLRRLD